MSTLVAFLVAITFFTGIAMLATVFELAEAVRRWWRHD